MKEKKLNYIFHIFWIIIVGAGTIWDFVTSMLGFLSILGLHSAQQKGDNILGIVISAVILGFAVIGMDIWFVKDCDDNGLDINTRLQSFATYPWVMAKLYDVWTSFVGTGRAVLPGIKEQFTNIGIGEVLTTAERPSIVLIIIMLSLLIASCPIMLYKSLDND